MAEGGKNYILKIKASLIGECPEGGTKAAWANMVGRGVLFDEIPDEAGRVESYGLKPERLGALAYNESTPAERGELQILLGETAEDCEESLRREHGAEIGADGETLIESELPFDLSAGIFRSKFYQMALRAAKTRGAERRGGDEVSRELSASLKRTAPGWNRDSAIHWRDSLGSEEYAKNWAGTTALTYTPETGTISAIPHKGRKGSPLTAHGTHVVPQDGGRRVLGVFAGGPDSEKFRGAVAEAYLETYLQEGALSDSERAAFEESFGGGKGQGRERARAFAEAALGDIRMGKDGATRDAWKIFQGHWRENAECPLQIGSAVAGGVHLGVLPEETLAKLFGKLQTWNPESGEVRAIVPDEQEGRDIARRYGEMWTPERREDRLTIISHSDHSFRQGSVGFIRVMRGEFLGGAQDGGEIPGDKMSAMLGPEASRFGGKVLGELDRLLGEIEREYGSAEDHGPASLPELCDRFLSGEQPGKNSPWKKEHARLRAAYEEYKGTQGGEGRTAGIEANEALRDAAAAFMVSRFGAKGEEAEQLRGAARALISAASKTGYLYIITDPCGSAVKIGITTNLPERLEDLGKENGPMCLVACYAFKSIPVSSWDTRLLEESTGGKNPGAFGALTGLSGQAALEAAERAGKRFSGLRSAFGYDTPGAEDAPEDFMAFCMRGMLSLCSDNEKLDGGRGVGRSDMLRKLGETEGISKELREPLARLWELGLAGAEKATEAPYQREALGALNRVILTVAAGGRDGARLAEAAEGYFGLLGTDPSSRDSLYKYGSQLGAAVGEMNAHRHFAFARRDKGEFFSLGDNFDQILGEMGKVAKGGEVHRYLLAESEDGEWCGRGKTLRKFRTEINTRPKPEISISWGRGTAERIKGLWESAKKLRTEAAVLDAEGRGKAEKASPEAKKDIPVHLQVAKILAGKDGKKTSVKDVVDSVGSLLGLDRRTFSGKLGLGDEGIGARTKYSSAGLGTKIIQAAHATVSETRKGAEEDIPLPELVESLAGGGDSCRKEARQRAAGMKIRGKSGGETNPHAMKLALGSGLGGLKGYPVTGSEEEKTAWRAAVLDPGKIHLVNTGRDSLRIEAAEIIAAADTLDNEWANGNRENRRILEAYGAASGFMPKELRAGEEAGDRKRGLSPKRKSGDRAPAPKAAAIGH